MYAIRSYYDYRRRHVRPAAVVAILPHQLRQHGEPHIYDDGLVGADQRLPVDAELLVLAVAGDEDAGLGVVAVSERDAGEGGDARVV